MPNSIFRLQSLTAASVVFADPKSLSHTLTQKVSNTPKKVGATDVRLNRAEMKEIVPRFFTDGTSTVSVDQVCGVSFSGYSNPESIADLKKAWERMKHNVDLAIADGLLSGFRSESVAFVAEISA